jgi:hypothetical protein
MLLGTWFGARLSLPARLLVLSSFSSKPLALSSAFALSSGAPVTVLGRIANRLIAISTQITAHFIVTSAGE